MKTIEMVTSQKVTITYQLAGLKDRMLAYLVDISMIISSNIVLSLIWLGIFRGDYFQYFYYFIFLPIFFFYSLVCDIFLNGQSVGKRTMEIRIVKLDGKDPSITDYLIRWSFRLIDIYFSLGAVASMLISSTAQNQRLGDFLANTTLIKLRSDDRVTLKDITNINSIDNYVTTYPQVHLLSENDLIIINEVLQRSKSYRNIAHQNALTKIAEKVACVIDVDLPENKREFLQTIIKDYIVLTR